MPEVKITGVCLEHVLSKPNDNGQVYHSLIIYENHQKYRRSVTEIKVGNDDDRVSKISAIDKTVGKICSIICDMSTYGDKVSYYFKGVVSN